MRLRSTARRLPAALTLSLLAGAAAAQGADARALHQAALAATCANCHGTQGRAVDGAAVPGLAGMPAAYLAEQMRAFKAGTRAATVMHQISKGYSDGQIDAIAAYFAAQKR
ncbi:MAG TPA: c-type cytochrome [Burkholderiaceae bacterium]|nr:c-type cytochrome [Burkholderiaceae bacterium]